MTPPDSFFLDLRGVLCESLLNTRPIGGARGSGKGMSEECDPRPGPLTHCAEGSKSDPPYMVTRFDGDIPHYSFGLRLT